MVSLIEGGAVSIGIASALIAAVCCTVVSRRGKLSGQKETSAKDRVHNS